MGCSTKFQTMRQLNLNFIYIYIYMGVLRRRSEDGIITKSMSGAQLVVFLAVASVASATAVRCECAQACDSERRLLTAELERERSRHASELRRLREEFAAVLKQVASIQHTRVRADLGDAGSRRLLQASEGGCTAADIYAVGVATNTGGVVADMLSTKPACAMCLIPCGALSGTAQFDCLAACLPNPSCTDEEASELAPLLATASLESATALRAMLAAVSAKCANCVVETYASVCGSDGLKLKLQFYTEGFATPRRCLPSLAARLMADQGQRVAATVSAATFWHERSATMPWKASRAT